MKPNNITITYKGKKHILNRCDPQGKYYQIGFENDRWSVRISLLQDNGIRMIINKSVRKPEAYSTQFCYDCYCTRSISHNGIHHTDRLSLNFVSDPATCRRIYRNVKWFVIEPMVDEIFGQLKDEILALHPFDLLNNMNDLKYFIYRKMEQHGYQEYTVNDSLRFGIGENAYAPTGEAMQAKEKEPIVLLNLCNGFHVVSKDTIVFYLYWLIDRDGKLTVSDGETTKEIGL